ncbi:hypothetical protein QCE63_28005 [Caballeronia sp. LZ065]|uniref:hypothetical protein n=1 Tax=Caballeronia sp. LZ065 TaxID=3038571 RepID=UPI00285568EA|nr:hypothetical protein [Caballeronia sp. LZ065]MDR5783258.1 hypothetical protein [Caballeronia sp. LZ065]
MNSTILAELAKIGASPVGFGAFALALVIGLAGRRLIGYSVTSTLLAVLLIAGTLMAGFYVAVLNSHPSTIESKDDSVRKSTNSKDDSLRPIAESATPANVPRPQMIDSSEKCVNKGSVSAQSGGIAIGVECQK